jgi:signal transduction histidine kinase
MRPRKPLQLAVRPGRSALYPIVAINARGVITKTNASARKLFAPLPEGIEGLNLGTLMARLAESGVMREPPRISLADANGERRDVMVALSEGAPGESTDQMANLSQDFKPGLRAPNRLADFIAHELRNPIGTIQGFAHILDQRFDLISPPDRAAALSTIHTEAERALLILDALLRLAERRTRTRVEMAEIPVHAVIRRVIEAHRRRNPHRRLEVSGDSPLFARANSLWIELAVGNLLSNAEKYTPKDRQIEVAFHQHGSKATISVLDQGTALSEAGYASLWDLYSSPDPNIPVSGSGIGLALCRDLVEGMGGQVWAGARNTGGSIFSLTLPSPWDSSVPAPLATRISPADSKYEYSSPEAWAA